MSTGWKVFAGVAGTAAIVAGVAGAIVIAGFIKSKKAASAAK